MVPYAKASIETGPFDLLEAIHGPGAGKVEINYFVAETRCSFLVQLLFIFLFNLSFKKIKQGVDSKIKNVIYSSNYS